MSWVLILAYAILLLCCGVLAFLNPVGTSLLAGVLLGSALVVYGFLIVVAAFSAMSARSRFLELILGLISLLAGVFAIYDPLKGAASVVWAVGLWLLSSGVLQAAYGLTGFHDRGWRLALGLIDLGLGAYLLFAGPLAGLSFIAALVGLSFTLRGLFLLNLAFAVRRSL